MPQRISRRDFGRHAAAAGLAATLTLKAEAQQPKAEDPDVKALEAKLERPLPAKLKAPAKAALANIKRLSQERLKYKLPEGSEPCTTFMPASARVTDR